MPSNSYIFVLAKKSGRAKKESCFFLQNVKKRLQEKESKKKKYTCCFHF
jgi:hypothetical protein